jgi:hypothetical protein
MKELMSAERVEGMLDINSTSIGTIGSCKTEAATPSSYRLAYTPEGEMVLQGAFHWTQGFAMGGFVWKTIPTELL